jgi:hypothetical protein
MDGKISKWFCMTEPIMLCILFILTTMHISKKLLLKWFCQLNVGMARIVYMIVDYIIIIIGTYSSSI